MNDTVLLIIVYTVGLLTSLYSFADGAWRTASPPEPGDLTMTTYNTKGFTLQGNSSQAPVLKGLIRHADILALQEIRGWSNTTRQRLATITPDDHRVIISDAKGRTPYYKERYAYIYNVTTVTMRSTGDLNATSVNRPPLTATVNASNFSFTTHNVHTDPETAGEEIQSIFDEARGDTATIILGDFNADCSYYDPSTPTVGWTWVVSAAADTTTGKTDCAYDRIAVNDAAHDNYRTSTVHDTPAWSSDHKAVTATFTTAHP